MKTTGKGFRYRFTPVKTKTVMTERGERTVQFSPAVRKAYAENARIDGEILKKNAIFTHMILRKGHQRAHRSGGTLIRSEKEMFLNIITGKIAECAAKTVMERTGKKVSDVDYSVTGVGKWDCGDLLLTLDDGRTWRVSVKATKSYGQYFMLETKDWDEYGCYRQSEASPERRRELIAKAKGGDGVFRAGRLSPDEKEEIGLYDIHVAVRVDAEFCSAVENALRKFGKGFGFDELWAEIGNLECGCEVSGCLYREELVDAMKDGLIVRKGWLIGKKQKMDADNFYLHLAELHRIA